jgi:hypothetical protein
VIDYETFCRLRQLHDERGLKVSQIAAELQLDPITVERWIDQPTYRQCQGTRRTQQTRFVPSSDRRLAGTASLHGAATPAATPGPGLCRIGVNLLY